VIVASRRRYDNKNYGCKIRAGYRGQRLIGQHLVRRLIERGDRVSCLVRATARLDELRSSGARLIVGDVTDRAGIERALAESQAGVVFHLAGLVKAVRPADFARVNAGGVESVAAACANRAGRPVLIVVSSLAAAGLAPPANLAWKAIRRRPFPPTVAASWRASWPRPDMPEKWRSPSCVRQSSSAPATGVCWKCSGQSHEEEFTSCPAGRNDAFH